MNIRNPVWKPHRHWLPTVNVNQLYSAYTQMRKVDIAPRKGLEENVDVASFLFTTRKIFHSLLSTREQPTEFAYLIKATWQARSHSRIEVQSDTDWRANHRLLETRGTYMDQPMVMLTLGTWEDCCESFYAYTGLDLTPNKQFQQKDLGTRVSLYNEEITHQLINCFD